MATSIDKLHDYVEKNSREMKDQIYKDLLELIGNIKRDIQPMYEITGKYPLIVQTNVIVQDDSGEKSYMTKCYPIMTRFSFISSTPYTAGHQHGFAYTEDIQFPPTNIETTIFVTHDDEEDEDDEDGENKQSFHINKTKQKHSMEENTVFVVTGCRQL